MDCGAREPGVTSGLCVQKASDVWACGIILYVLLCGVKPWKRAAFSDTRFKHYFQVCAGQPTSISIYVLTIHWYSSEVTEWVGIGLNRDIVFHWIGCSGENQRIIGQSLDPPAQHNEFRDRAWKMISPAAQALVLGMLCVDLERCARKQQHEHWLVRVYAGEVRT
jgi:serine/threonine protein kinase